MGSIKYFLGCSSPEGFHSFFGELCPTHSGGYTYNKGRSGHGQIESDETDKLRPDRRGD